MLTEAKMNYKQQFGENIWCSSCKLFPSSQEHLFSCFIMRKKIKSDINFNEISYDDIFGSLNKQEAIAKAFTKVLKVHQELKEKTLPPSSGEDHSTEDLDSTMGSVILDAAVS